MRCFQLWMISQEFTLVEKIALMDGRFTKCKIRLMRLFKYIKSHYVRDLVYLFPTYNFLYLLNQVFDRKWVLEVLRWGFHTWVKNHDWLVVEMLTWFTFIQLTIYIFYTFWIKVLTKVDIPGPDTYLICLTVFW